MVSWQQRNLTIDQRQQGYTTSVEQVRGRTYTTVPVVGVKRDFEQAAISHTTYPPVAPVDALAEVTSGARIPQNRLQASRIVKTGTADTDHDRTGVRTSCTPRPSQHPILSLGHVRYNLPTSLVDNFRALGVRAIYPWQSSCILGKGFLEGSKNLIYTAPTGGGKSLVADVLLARRIIDNPTLKAIVVLPYVALVQEKTRWLRRLFEGVCKNVEKVPDINAGLGLPRRDRLVRKDIHVVPIHGGSQGKLTWADFDVAVCTIEKANSLINGAVENGTINELGIIVLDELHMLDDEHRGYIMELMVTKIMTLKLEIQIVGMSATLANPELLAKWLRAKFFVAKYRPVPIEENLVYDNAVYSTANSKDFFKTATQLTSTSVTQLSPDPNYIIEKSVHQELNNPVQNAVVALAIETTIAGYGSLVFCSSRQGSQITASLISDAIPSSCITQDILVERLALLAALQALPGGFEQTFAKTIPCGVAFHHAGLTLEERDIVAEAYDAGTLKVMVATCSLAAGINLPARRVILNGARMGRELVGPAMLRQMRGRAGRKGKDEIGQTFLCCQKQDLEAVADLLEADLPPVVSSLVPEKRGIKRAILEVIATRLAYTYDGLRDYIRHSLLWWTTDSKCVLAMLDTSLAALIDDGLVAPASFDTYISTTVGAAIVASSLTPQDGLFVHCDLRKALSSFVMDSELHLLYLFTPIPQPSPIYALTAEISWPIFRTTLDKMDEPSIRALRLIGISPALVNRLANGGVANLPETTVEEIHTARVYRRAYSTFALRDLCNEIPIHTISLRYSLPRGSIQNLAQSCHGFAAGMIKFCQRMASGTDANAIISSLPDPNSAGFSMLAVVLEHMVDRLRASARADLLEMAQVTFVKGRMARLLYESGFKSVRAIAEADPRRDIVPVMLTVQGWKMRKRFDNADDPSAPMAETDVEWDMRTKLLEDKLEEKARVMVKSAARIWERECLKMQDLEE